MRTASVALCCAVLFSALGCASQATAIRSLLTRDEAVAIAEKAAKSEGIDLGKYDMTACRYEYTEAEANWSVLFVQKPPTPPGGHFLVWVNDKTKTTQLMHGE
jgi:hypothetical protein